MSRRLDQKETSAVWLNLRLTEEEKAEWKALARYLQMTVSDLLRNLVSAKREQLIAEGKKPPRK